MLKHVPDEEAEKDGANTYCEKIHYRANLKHTGYVIYSVRMVLCIWGKFKLFYSVNSNFVVI